MNEIDTHSDAAFELRFESFFHAGRGLAFPCDARGEVNLGALSARARENLHRAWSATGRDYAWPAVEPCVLR